MLCKLLMLSTQSRDSKYIYSMCKPTCSTTQQNTNRCFIYIERERERERITQKNWLYHYRGVSEMYVGTNQIFLKKTQRTERESGSGTLCYTHPSRHMGTRIPWIMFGKPIARNSGRKAKHQDLNKGTYRIIEAHCVFCINVTVKIIAKNLKTLIEVFSCLLHIVAIIKFAQTIRLCCLRRRAVL